MNPSAFIPPARPLSLPPAPRPVAALVRTLPLWPLSLALTAFTRDLLRQHPALPRRLGDYARRRYLLELTDLPLALLIAPAQPSVRAYRRAGDVAHDARISGTVAAFLGMVHGQLDGDALFFSRDLEIGGDTEAVLALRNAIDDAELDLSAEAARLSGRLGPALRHALGLAERASGLMLSRAPMEGRLS